MDKQNILKIEREIEETLTYLYCDLTMKQWSYYIQKYNALCIRLIQMKGDRVQAMTIKSDYII